MSKQDKRILLITSVVCLLPIIWAIVLYDQLPELIAVHWNNGVPDGFLPKAAAGFGLPVFLAAVNLVSKIVLLNDPKKLAHSSALKLISIWSVPVLTMIIMPVTLYIALGVNIPIDSVITAVVGIVLIIVGNYLPKSRQNYTMGIKLPWTLDDADNWNKTHRLAGYLWMFGGVIFVASAFVIPDVSIWGISITIVVTILLVGVPVIFSYLLYRKTRIEQKPH